MNFMHKTKTKKLFYPKHMTTSIYTSICKNRLLLTALEECEDFAGQNATINSMYVYYTHFFAIKSKFESCKLKIKSEYQSL